MKNLDREPHTGTLPGYLPAAEAAKLAGMPIDATRPLSIHEYSDMLAAGLERKDIVGMTPEMLSEYADVVVERSELFVGP